MKNPFVKWLLGLFDNNPGGASVRKFLALWVMVLVTLLHTKYLSVQVTKTAAGTTSDWDYGTTLLYADYIMVGLLIGFIVVQDILKFKIGGSKEPPKDEVTPENKETPQS